jgi:hypothetical protein
MKEGIGKLSEGMPIFMNALDELKAVHPFIGGALTPSPSSLLGC